MLLILLYSRDVKQEIKISKAELSNNFECLEVQIDLRKMHNLCRQSEQLRTLYQISLNDTKSKYTKMTENIICWHSYTLSFIHNCNQNFSL